MKNTLVKSGLISVVLTLLGVLFKIMHWPGASIMLVLGVATFGLLFIPLLITLKFKDEEEPIDKWVLSIGLVLGMTTSIGVLFKVMHWPGSQIIILSSLAAFILLFVPTYFITKYRRADLKFNTAVNSVLMMACGCLLFALFTTGNSRSYTVGTTPTYDFLSDNTDKMNTANVKIASDVKDYSGFEEIHDKSRALYGKVADIKSNLIAKSEGISIEEAEKFNLIELQKPLDFNVVQKEFINAGGKLSLKVLLTEVADYNSMLSTKYPDQDEKVVAADKLQLRSSSISIILAELTQIQLKIATNENSYLNQLSIN